MAEVLGWLWRHPGGILFLFGAYLVLALCMAYCLWPRPVPRHRRPSRRSGGGRHRKG